MRLRLRDAAIPGAASRRPYECNFFTRTAAALLDQNVGGVLTQRTQASFLPGLVQLCFMLLAK